MRNVLLVHLVGVGLVALGAYGVMRFTWSPFLTGAGIMFMVAGLVAILIGLVSSMLRAAREWQQF